MADTGTLKAPEQIPDWSQEWPGEPLVKFPLRSTPKPHIRLVPGNSNQSFSLRSVAVPEWPELVKAARINRGARPAGQTVTLDVSVFGQGALASALSRTVRFATSISGAGSVVSNLVRLRAFFVVLAGSGSVVADQSGGTIGGLLALTPEDPSDTLTMSEETGDALTLTPEDPSDSLPLTPG